MENLFWYLWIPNDENNFISPEYYTFSGPTKPLCKGEHRICAILAEDDGYGKPIILEKILTEDLVNALQHGRDYGIVLINKKHKRTQYWIYKLLDYI